jgi:transposase InsO family protein
VFFRKFHCGLNARPISKERRSVSKDRGCVAPGFAGSLHSPRHPADSSHATRRTGNCWDNAAMESFFGTLKTELIYHERYTSRAEARQSIADYIEMFYNTRRRHSTLGYVNPAEFENMTG